MTTFNCDAVCQLFPCASTVRVAAGYHMKWITNLFQNGFGTIIFRSKVNDIGNATLGSVHYILCLGVACGEISLPCERC